MVLLCRPGYCSGGCLLRCPSGLHLPEAGTSTCWQPSAAKKVGRPGKACKRGFPEHPFPNNPKPQKPLNPKPDPTPNLSWQAPDPNKTHHAVCGVSGFWGLGFKGLGVQGFRGPGFGSCFLSCRDIDCDFLPQFSVLLRMPVAKHAIMVSCDKLNA